MGKQAAPRKVGDKEALAVGNTIRGSARKLNLVAQMIRGRKVEEALNILKFSPKGMADDVAGDEPEAVHVEDAEGLRVGANSPSFMPTMSSLTDTGTNLRPL